MIRDPSGVPHEVQKKPVLDSSEEDLVMSDGWWDTCGVGCDECHSILYSNGEVWKCNGCGREYDPI